MQHVFGRQQLKNVLWCHDIENIFETIRDIVCKCEIKVGDNIATDSTKICPELDFGHQFDLVCQAKPYRVVAMISKTVTDI